MSIDTDLTKLAHADRKTLDSVWQANRNNSKLLIEVMIRREVSESLSPSGVVQSV